MVGRAYNIPTAGWRLFNVYRPGQALSDDSRVRFRQQGYGRVGDIALNSEGGIYYPSDMSVSANGRLAPADRLIQSVRLFQRRWRPRHIDYAQTFGLVQLCQHALIGAPLHVT